MPNNPYRVTLTAPSTTTASPVWVPDTDAGPNVNLGIAVVSTAATSFVVEHSMDYTGSSNFLSSNATWFLVSSSSGITASNYTQFTGVTSILRLNSTAASTTVPITMTIMQAG